MPRVSPQLLLASAGFLCLFFLTGYASWLAESNAQLRDALRESEVVLQAAVAGCQEELAEETVHEATPQAGVLSAASGAAAHQAAQTPQPTSAQPTAKPAAPAGPATPAAGAGAAAALCPNEPSPRVAYCFVGAAAALPCPVQPSSSRLSSSLCAKNLEPAWAFARCGTDVLAAAGLHERQSQRDRLFRRASARMRVLTIVTFRHSHLLV